MALLQMLCCKSLVPGSDLTYFKTNIKQKFYRPLGFANLVFGFDGELGYIGHMEILKNSIF